MASAERPHGGDGADEPVVAAAMGATVARGNTPPYLQMLGVSKRYSGTQALRDVDFSARRGEVHAIVGENGAGNSTLTRILTGADPVRRRRDSALTRNAAIDTLKVVASLPSGTEIVFDYAIPPATLGKEDRAAAL